VPNREAISELLREQFIQAAAAFPFSLVIARLDRAIQYTST
jgi:hypothetical protein